MSENSKKNESDPMETNSNIETIQIMDQTDDIVHNPTMDTNETSNNAMESSTDNKDSINIQEKALIHAENNSSDQMMNNTPDVKQHNVTEQVTFDYQSLDSPPEDEVIEEIKQEPNNDDVVLINWEPNITIHEDVKPNKRHLDNSMTPTVPRKRIKDENGNPKARQENVKNNVTKVCVGCEGVTRDIAVLLLNFPKHWTAKLIKKCISSNVCNTYLY